MKAIFNSRVIDTSKPLFHISNRAFCYGDGLFETIVTGRSRIDLTVDHLDRLKRGSEVLGLDFPKELSPEFFRKSITQLTVENDLNGDVRTKLILWRKEGGLYTPESTETNYLIECKAATKPFIRKARKIGFSGSYRTNFSPISFAKTTNALIYVLAGKDMKFKGWDEIILTDVHGNVSETHVGNVFWIQSEIIYTPPISTGCIEGIMRNALIKAAINAGIEIKESLIQIDELKKADAIFCTNASGITIYESFLDNELVNCEPMLEPIIKRLLQP